MSELIEELREGVTPLGLHDDNTTELFDVSGADEKMAEAADALTTAQAEAAALRSEVERLREALRKIDRMNDHPQWFRKSLNDILEAALGPKP